MHLIPDVCVHLIFLNWLNEINSNVLCDTIGTKVSLCYFWNHFKMSRSQLAVGVQISELKSNMIIDNGGRAAIDNWYSFGIQLSRSKCCQ